MSYEDRSNEALIWYHHDELLRLHCGESFCDLFTKHAQDSLNKYGLVESIRLNGLKAKVLSEYTKKVLKVE